jgi:hypothetical protein
MMIALVDDESATLSLRTRWMIVQNPQEQARFGGFPEVRKRHRQR